MKILCFRMTWLRLIVILVIALACLQLLHMSMLSQLEIRNNQFEIKKSRFIFKKVALKQFQEIQNALHGSSILDSSGQYRIIHFLLKSKTQQEESQNNVNGLTLLTQCSANRLHYLIDLANQWSAPISIAVFTISKDIKNVVRTLLYLQFCVPAIREYVSIHLVFPFASNIEAITETDIDMPHDVCHNLKDELQKRYNTTLNYDLQGVPYPNNLLRNIALRNAHTDHIFLIDIDFIPSKNLHSNFLNFAQTNGIFDINRSVYEKTVYVVPAFETRNKISIPSNKDELLLQWKKSEIRPFYYELCWKCQKQLDYEAWGLANSTKSVTVAYEIEWKDPWEPFYITRKTIPVYDERFKQYGFNRISQVCEVHFAGYTFAVLNNAFLLHKGYKLPSNFHKTKEQEQQRNRILFRQFKEQLKTKYPNSTRRCY
ncbi:unnamed protein product [Owenia fusiformis]|uniref:Beta-1,4-glucuronyltransferase 1 n=1 Tax=Owenia fusiformis TaxID=6347 RepID=A0A8S4PGF1_OWEFU|nr:unnamed protein product [Owenia fusiformis]